MIMRNKNKFLELDRNHVIHCKICDRDLTKNSFTYRDVQENCNIGICRYCCWLRRHNDTIPLIDGWTESEVKLLIDFIMNNESIYLNDALSLFNDKTLKELCRAYTLLHTCKPSKVKVNCEYCGKEIEVIPYNYNIKNEFGKSFNFCSQKCYHSFRSIYYIGDKCPAYGREMSEDLKNKLRTASLKRMKSEDRLNSKIQLIINDILDKNKIKYEREYFIKYYSIDNYLLDYNLMIEVMGNYWHSNPVRYNEDKYLMNVICL